MSAFPRAIIPFLSQFNYDRMALVELIKIWNEMIILIFLTIVRYNKNYFEIFNRFKYFYWMAIKHLNLFMGMLLLSTCKLWFLMLVKDVFRGIF